MSRRRRRRLTGSVWAAGSNVKKKTWPDRRPREMMIKKRRKACSYRALATAVVSYIQQQVCRRLWTSLWVTYASSPSYVAPWLLRRQAASQSVSRPGRQSGRRLTTGLFYIKRASSYWAQCTTRLTSLTTSTTTTTILFTKNMRQGAAAAARTVVFLLLPRTWNTAEEGGISIQTLLLPWVVRM